MHQGGGAVGGRDFDDGGGHAWSPCLLTGRSGFGPTTSYPCEPTHARWRNRQLPVISRHAAPHLVVALAYDRLCTFEFGCVVELFALPRPELDVRWYDFAVCAAERGPLRAAGGITVTAPNSLKIFDRADTIVIPGWRDAHEPPPRICCSGFARPTHAVRGSARSAPVSSCLLPRVCSTANASRHTGVMRSCSRSATPSIRVEPNSLYIDQGQVLTSAGSAAGLDMLLHLVRRDHGPKVANQVAQRLVIPPHRDGDQAQFVPRPVAPDESSRLSRLLDWIRGHLGETHSIASLARRAGMSPRTLLRRFKEATDLAPNEWLVRERVAAAREMLESGRVALGRVAERAGFGSQESFRRHFGCR